MSVIDSQLNLETIPLEEVKIGMMIHQIGEQVGKLVVKKKGRLKHKSVLEQLSINGVKSVIVELPKIEASAEPEPENKIPAYDLFDDAGDDEDTSMSAQQEPITNTSIAKLNQQKQYVQDHKNDNKIASGDLEIELEQANILLKQGFAIHKGYAADAKIGLNLDFSSAQRMVGEMHDSLEKNPNALLCMSTILQSHSYLAEHASRVSILMCFIAQQLGMSQEDCKRLGLLGYLFDIGMVKVPKTIVQKSGSLGEDERKKVEEHVQYSLELLAPLNLDSEMQLAIEQHHERLHGKGYPNGFAGAKIQKFSRLLAIADCYTSLTSERPYRGAMSPAAAMKVLSDQANGYDQKLVMKFIRCLGIYPVGSLVALSNNRIALVTQSNTKKPNSPEVKVFYSITGKHYLPAQIINLSTQHNQLKISKPVLAKEFDLSLDRVVGL